MPPPITAVAVRMIPASSAIRSHPDGARPCSSAAIESATARQNTVVNRTRRPAGHCESMRATVLAQGSRDDEPLDLVRALVDLGDLGIAHVALHRVLGHVAVAAEHLDGLDGHG